MKSNFILFVSYSLIMIILGTGITRAQNYPTKSIRMFTAGVGGSGDFAARLLAQGLAESMGQQVIVENRSGVIPAETVAKAPPDGYTLLFHGSAIWLTPLLQGNTSYDPVRDFSPITLAASSPNILIVHPSLPVNSVKELIVLAKAKPGTLNYSAGSVGGSSFLAAELFKALAAVNIVRVTYKTDGLEIAGLIGGEVQLTFGAMASMIPLVKAGKLKALAVTGAEPSPLLPDLPTIDAAGLPGYEAVSILGLWAPAGTAPATISRLNEQSVRILNRQDVKEKFLNTGVGTVGGSPKDFAAKIASEMVKWGKIFKDAGIKAN